MNILFLGDHRIELYLIYDCAISMISCSLNFDKRAWIIFKIYLFIGEKCCHFILPLDMLCCSLELEITLFLHNSSGHSTV